MSGEVAGAAAVFGAEDTAGTETVWTVGAAEREIERNPVEPSSVPGGDVVTEKTDLLHLPQP